ncbi:MAG: alpha/beta hydrolase [Saprospiraceae bacterium]
MQKAQFTILVLILFFNCIEGLAQDTILYKQIDTTQLYLELRYPENMDTTKQYPAVVFFFGGGWVGGSRSHFEHHADYFAKRGLVCFLADYRTAKGHGTTPFECLKDAKSAIRFIRAHASGFHIDPSKLIAAGGSAGGHLAVATALIEGYNEDQDDLGMSCTPNALMLFNPVFDNGPGGYGFERIGEQYKNFSPLHNIRKGAPPTIVFFGTQDNLVPVETAEYFQVVMNKVGSRCELNLYEGQGHGFFNYGNFDFYKKTLLAADTFLQSLGYLNAEPVVVVE